jgi:hypothetical protein
MLKTTKKDTLQEEIFNLETILPNKITTYKELYLKYKRAGNEEKAEEYAKLIEEMSKNKEIKPN